MDFFKTRFTGVSRDRFFRYYSGIKVQDIDGLKGAKLDEVMDHFGLIKNLAGAGRVEDKKHRLKQILSDPTPRTNYPTYFSKKQKLK